MNPNKTESKPKTPQNPKGDRDTQISKALSKLLRHGAVKEKLSIDEAGFVAVNEILNHNRLKTHKATLEDLKRVVDTNDKQRFKLLQDGGKLLICANQGHSIKAITTDNLQAIEHKSQLPTAPIFHGTYSKILPLIKQSGGLNTMSRNHIHLTDNINYIRKTCNTLIYIDVEQCLADGIKVYKSENNVFLTSGIDGTLPAKYFNKVAERFSGREIDFNSI